MPDEFYVIQFRGKYFGKVNFRRIQEGSSVHDSISVVTRPWRATIFEQSEKAIDLVRQLGSNSGYKVVRVNLSSTDIFSY